MGFPPPPNKHTYEKLGLGERRETKSNLEWIPPPRSLPAPGVGWGEEAARQRATCKRGGECTQRPGNSSSACLDFLHALRGAGWGGGVAPGTRSSSWGRIWPLPPARLQGGFCSALASAAPALQTRPEESPASPSSFLAPHISPAASTSLAGVERKASRGGRGRELRAALGSVLTRKSAALDGELQVSRALTCE